MHSMLLCWLCFYSGFWRWGRNVRAVTHVLHGSRHQKQIPFFSISSSPHTSSKENLEDYFSSWGRGEADGRTWGEDTSLLAAKTELWHLGEKEEGKVSALPASNTRSLPPPQHTAAVQPVLWRLGVSLGINTLTCLALNTRGLGEQGTCSCSHTGRVWVGVLTEPQTPSPALNPASQPTSQLPRISTVLKK